MRQAVLTEIELPDFGEPRSEPRLGAGIHAARLQRLEERMADLDAVVVYGDREHSANIAWATGFDPRFEEAILIVVPGRLPHLLIGNEGFAYAGIALGRFERVLWQPLSLMGQPRDKYVPLAQLLVNAGLKSGMRIGLAGWKGFEDEAGRFDKGWFETPAYLVEALRAFGTLTNAALLFMNPADGLRAINEVDQLACFEYAATLASNAVRRAIAAARPGASEYDVVRAMGLDGFPHSVHLMMSAGPRAAVGLGSPSSRRIELGDPATVAFGLAGALNCRAGFVAADASELPAPIRDYVDRLVAPYFEAVVAWYETLAIGVTGAELCEAVMSRLGDPFFGIGLNPGHLIHLDEWLHSPVKRGSAVKLASGMALQCDIIPATGTPYFTTNIEDGVALVDEAGRREFASHYPEAWRRIESRRRFMTETLGIALKPEVLPFSNLAAWLPPFWLSPDKAMAMTGTRHRHSD